MDFCDKLRAARRASGISQAALAKGAGITARSVQYYESGQRQPQSTAIILALARVLDVPVTDLIDDPGLERTQEEMRKEAQRIHSAAGRQQLNDLLKHAAALMASGTLDEADELAFMRAINDIYFDAKQKNGVPPKEYRIEDYQE